MTPKKLDHPLEFFVALGGTSYAALRVTGDNVVDNSLRGRDVKNDSLGTRDIANLRATDFAPTTTAFG